MQEEVDQKTIALAVKTGKLTGQVLQAAMKKFLAARQKGKAKPHHGHQSLRQLKKDGSALSNIEITDANIGLFKPCAKKYDIDYTLRKDSSTHPPRYKGTAGRIHGPSDGCWFCAKQKASLAPQERGDARPS